jgi:hypothetical protein
MNRLSLLVAAAIAVILACDGSRAAEPTTLDLNTIVRLLESRERAVQSFDARIEDVERTGDDILKYYEAKEDDRAASARLYGYKYERRPVPDRKSVTSMQTVTWRVQWVESGEQRIEFIPVGSYQSYKVDCFDGKVWQTSYPERRRVLLSSSVKLPPTFEVIGLGGEFLQFAEPSPVTQVLALSRALREAAENGLAEAPKAIQGKEIGEAVQITFMRSVTHAYPNALRPVFLKVTVTLDPSRGLAPLTAVGEQLIQMDTGLEFQGITSFAGKWGDFVEGPHGMWVAKNFEVNRFEYVMKPKTSAGFRIRMKNGKPLVLRGSLPEIDLASVIMEKFAVVNQVFRVEQLALNTLTGPPVCATELAAGTVVEDRDEGAVYQMTGAGKAVDEAMRRTIYGPTETEEPESRWTSVSIWINIAIIVAIISLIVWFRIARKPTALN